MKSFTEDLSMTILVLSQRINFTPIDLNELQVQNIINEIIQYENFYPVSNFFSIHIDFNINENFYSIEILLKKELDIEIREKFYNELEPVNTTNNSKAKRNENYTELKLSKI